MSVNCQVWSCIDNIMLRTSFGLLSFLVLLHFPPAAMAQGNGNANGQASEAPGNNSNSNGNDNANAGGGNTNPGANGNASPGANDHGNHDGNSSVGGQANDTGAANASAPANSNAAVNSGGADSPPVGNNSNQSAAVAVSPSNSGAAIDGSDTSGSSLPGLEAAPSPNIRIQSQEAALQAVQSGAAVPLETIVRRLAVQADGQLIDASLIRVEGFLLYQVKVMSPAGRVTTQYFYARTGQPVTLR